MHSFGSSDCWTTKFIGDWDNLDKKNKIADLLFSTDTLSNGNPKGIGLSLWRFNIGAGSFEQGDSSDITTDWRREECFLNPDGSYNWSKQSGQQWFLQAARKRGVKYTVGFAISPPVSMTKNGKAFSSGGNALNIKPEKLERFADFLITVSNHFHFDYISPVNEPQWAWAADKNGKAGQEGSPAQNDEIASLTRLLSQKITTTHASAEIIIGEAAQWNYLYDINKDGRGDQIAQFFSSSSPDYIGNLPHVKQAISAHSYFTTCPEDVLIGTRQQVTKKIDEVNPALETWQTEFGVLGNICNKYNGSPRHTSIDYGLYVATVIHEDITNANVSSWQWWLAVNPYNYSDGLVYINDPSGAINVDNCKKDGIVLESKQLWALGNYSRFIRPGMKRVSASITSSPDSLQANGVLVSAYKDDHKKELVIVLINTGDKQKIITLDDQLSFTNNHNIVNAYTTSADKNMERSFMKTNRIIIDQKSIITLTGQYDPEP